MSSMFRNDYQRRVDKFKIIRLVADERDRQETLKAEGRFAYTCADKELTNLDKLAILLRELGEVSTAVNVAGDKREKLLSQQNKEQLRAELVQVAAVAVAWAESLSDE